LLSLLRIVNVPVSGPRLCTCPLAPRHRRRAALPQPPPPPSSLPPFLPSALPSFPHNTSQALLDYKQAILEGHASTLYEKLNDNKQLAKLDDARLREFTRAVKKFCTNLLEEVALTTAAAAPAAGGAGGGAGAGAGAGSSRAATGGAGGH
jgi:hypothetical protein